MPQIAMFKDSTNQHSATVRLVYAGVSINMALNLPILVQEANQIAVIIQQKNILFSYLNVCEHSKGNPLVADPNTDRTQLHTRSQPKPNDLPHPFLNAVLCFVLFFPFL